MTGDTDRSAKQIPRKCACGAEYETVIHGDYLDLECPECGDLKAGVRRV